MFHPTNFWNVILLLLLLACALPASFMTLAAPRRSYSTITAAAAKEEDCPGYGCPLLPLDVIKSEPTRKGLEFLRRQAQHQVEERKDPVEYTKVMESLKSAGNEDKVVLTLMGYKGGSLASQINQDSATIISPYLIGPKQDYYDAQFLGVFDGHGKLGEITSDHASKAIPRILAQKLNDHIRSEQVRSATALKESIVTKAIQESFIEADQSDPTGGVGGATATMILQLGHRLYVANAGDSRSFIGVYVDGTVQLAYASREDKPDVPEERRRITEAGGYVHIPADPREDVPRAYYVDPQGRARYGLAMSRTIGDWQVQGVIAEPIVDVLNIATLVRQAMKNHTESCRSDQTTYMLHQGEEKKSDDNNKYDDRNDDSDIDCPTLDPSNIQIVAISASDGMMDYLKPEVIASEMGSSFFGIDNNNKHPFVVAEYLILRAAEGWDSENFGRYRDDIVLSAAKVIIDDKILAAGRLLEESEEEHDEL